MTAEARLEKKSRLRPARVVAMSWVIGRQVESSQELFQCPWQIAGWSGSPKAGWHQGYLFLAGARA